MDVCHKVPFPVDFLKIEVVGDLEGIRSVLVRLWFAFLTAVSLGVFCLSTALLEMVQTFVL